MVLYAPTAGVAALERIIELLDKREEGWRLGSGVRGATPRVMERSDIQGVARADRCKLGPCTITSTVPPGR